MTPLMTEPDSKYEYCNAGINIAGRIIEVLSGMSYEQFMTKRLFEPLGMVDTVTVPCRAQAGRIAKSYRSNTEANRLDREASTRIITVSSRSSTNFLTWALPVRAVTFQSIVRISSPI